MLNGLLWWQKAVRDRGRLWTQVCASAILICLVETPSWEASPTDEPR